jgi:hypothetical protein
MDHARWSRNRYFVNASTLTNVQTDIDKLVDLLNRWSIPPNLYESAAVVKVKYHLKDE